MWGLRVGAETLKEEEDGGVLLLWLSPEGLRWIKIEGIFRDEDSLLLGLIGRRRAVVAVPDWEKDVKMLEGGGGSSGFMLLLLFLCLFLSCLLWLILAEYKIAIVTGSSDVLYVIVLSECVHSN